MKLTSNRSSIEYDYEPGTGNNGAARGGVITLMLKAPTTSARAVRNIQLVLDDSTPQAKIVSLTIGPRLPARYQDLPNLPLINIDVEEYNRWVEFHDQCKAQKRRSGGKEDRHDQ